jgi:hypothetical protein
MAQNSPGQNHFQEEPPLLTPRLPARQRLVRKESLRATEGQVSLRGCPRLRNRPKARAPERNAPPHMREVSLGFLERSPSNALARGCNMMMVKVLLSRTGHEELSHRGIANIRARSAINRYVSPPILGQDPLQQTGNSR